MLFILNVVIFGRLERNLDDDDMFFLPHSVKEEAKILWRDGAAVGFYTIKMKGKGHTAVGRGGGGGALPLLALRKAPRYLPASEDSLSTSIYLERIFCHWGITHSAVM